jgi:Asp-tRNA(Asn)/Glu-tRNA(Gln) amidotransferase A subunit family amidase
MELEKLTATEAAELIATRKISSEELTRACLARIRDREPAVQAWVALDEDLAIAAAKAADAVKPASPLHGIPFGVKDIIDTGDLPTEYGSIIFQGHRPAQDAACVARMKAAGGVMLGKTVCTEFATYHPGKKKTRNPHSLTHTPGGSSSGSAAAVADYMVPLAFGGQTAGSHIRPASYCGIPGFKPTHGTVDTNGIFALEPMFDTLGYYARSFDDIAAFYAAVRRVPRSKLADGLGRPLRLGIYRGLDHYAEPAALAAVEACAQRLAALGATIVEATLPAEYEALPEVHTTLLNVGLSRSFAGIYPSHRDKLGDRLRGIIENGMRRDPAEYEAAVVYADGCKREINAALGAHDLLLCPSAPGEPPEGSGDSTGSPIFQTMWTLLQVPCANIPAGTGPTGLPVGVQVIGRRDDDENVLRASKWLHARLN